MYLAFDAVKYSNDEGCAKGEAIYWTCFLRLLLFLVALMRRFFLAV